jgi:2-(1,2-epoxy-1,2-dihydrophenyl)acetyl-CoA isomerase
VTEKLIDSGMTLLDLAGNGVAHLTLNRPEAANGMSVPFLRSLYDALMRCHGEPRLRVLVVSGAGPNFCAGGDIKDFASKG